MVQKVDKTRAKLTALLSSLLHVRIVRALESGYTKSRRAILPGGPLPRPDMLSIAGVVKSSNEHDASFTTCGSPYEGTLLIKNVTLRLLRHMARDRRGRTLTKPTKLMEPWWCVWAPGTHKPASQPTEP